MKDKGMSIKVTKDFKAFLDNLRASRRSKAFGIDEDLLSQKDTCDLLVKYFKLNSEAFLELIKLKFEEKNVG